MTSTSNTTKAASVGLPKLDLVPAEGPGPFFCGIILEAKNNPSGSIDTQALR